MCFSEAVSVFGFRVANVVKLRSEKQMFNAETRRIVAMMANKKSVLNRAVGEYPHNSVDSNGIAVDVHMSILRSIPWSGPYETVAVNRRSTHEILVKNFGLFYREGSHGRLFSQNKGCGQGRVSGRTDTRFVISTPITAKSQS